jgi:hypothetical protein
LTWFHSTQEQVAVAAQDGVRRFDNAAAESFNRVFLIERYVTDIKT